MDNIKFAVWILIAVAVVAALEIYDRYRENDVMMTRLIKLCESEAPCQAAVEEYSEQCFYENYHFKIGIGSFPHLQKESFVNCLNKRSDKDWFILGHGIERVLQIKEFNKLTNSLSGAEANDLEER